MRQAIYDWQLSESEPTEMFLQSIKQENLSPFIGKLLWQRGYRDVEKVKEEYHLRPIDRINKTMDAIDMVSTIISTLNS